MIHVIITEKGQKPQARQFDQPEVTIGRIVGNDIVLPKGNISKRHARLVDNQGVLVIVDAKSTNGTYYNGKRLSDSQNLAAGDKVYVGDFLLEASLVTSEIEAPRALAKGRAAQLETREIAPEHAVMLKNGDWEEEREEEAPKAPAHQKEMPRSQPAPAKKAPATVAAEVDDGDESNWDAGLVEEAEPARASAPQKEQAFSPTPTAQPQSLPEEQSGIVALVHQELSRSVKQQPDDSSEAFRKQVQETVQQIVNNMAHRGELPKNVRPEMLVDCVIGEAVGLGPLEQLLADPTVTEILVNNARQIYVERRGKLEPSELVFSSDEAVLGVIERIVKPLGRRIDAKSPMVDARLKDGSRVNAIVPPLSVKGPVLTIRKFRREPMQIDDLVAQGSLNADMAEFLESAVRARKNLVVAGGTGSGKTTLLNVLSSFIDSDERIITIEDAAELKLEQQHVVSLEARPSDVEGLHAVTIRDLVRNALRMRPDRIVVGECRGGETLDMLQAMNTGHDGSLTTVHANGPREALTRLETLVLMAGMDLPARAIREQVANAVEIMVQQARFADGTRRITHISEITGMEGEIISMHDLFVFEQQGVDAGGKIRGRFRATGFVPKFYDELKTMGLQPNLTLFRPR